METDGKLTFIGKVLSPLKTLEACPFQGRDGAPSAEIHILPQFRPAMKRMKAGAKVVILTWFHQSDRTILQVHPQCNPQIPLTGVFLTRSPVRPNPIGLHEVVVERVNLEKGILEVAPLEALDQTPIIDIKLSLPRPKSQETNDPKRFASGESRGKSSTRSKETSVKAKAEVHHA